ncbi:nuclear transport factor 2 family protein [Microbispora sp. H10830]|uniref:nuclear transport factor 2 family protein n=1 Tax=Microbispora sp. H10830 TaxID=2729109 RepID=UPI001601ACF3|nr:nuclear transport factor 2 family protein [Microbispora sp. H10830]
MSTPSPREIADRFLRASVANAWDDLADLYASDAVIEIPFAPEGVPTRSQGRELFRARFKAAAPLRRFEKAGPVVIHETRDPEVVIVEYDLHGSMTRSGRPFVFSYVMVMRIRDGLIVHSRDYANPLAGAEFRDELAEAISQ